ncbi:hypothetical protein V1477_008702 [Vespula maculifrons]|uniref:Uncharacterized protein n=5 Tax=Vespula TaxID=7451 RepID=A0A834JVL2_VESGE|nr:hypothetical protein HZH66_009566 [Vespula vulgaris]KAF7393779.1 hypothetical protein HZH68_010598 [Vespula germanica]KAF7416941.1 hypothetical protein H0235_011472 [Vespula pensylvanica]
MGIELPTEERRLERVNRNAVNRFENYENPFVDRDSRLEPPLRKQWEMLSNNEGEIEFIDVTSAEALGVFVSFDHNVWPTYSLDAAYRASAVATPTEAAVYVGLVERWKLAITNA